MYGKQLKCLREDKELTQEFLGNILGITKEAYGQYEREYTIIPIKHLNALCNYFTVPLDYIFSFSTDKYVIINKEINRELSGSRLKIFRKENNLTQDKLASILNVAPSVIRGYEKGRYLIATPFLYTICKKYNISADYLLGRIDTPKYFK